jgi:hypothetical protein
MTRASPGRRSGTIRNLRSSRDTPLLLLNNLVDVLDLFGNRRRQPGASFFRRGD